MQNNSSPAESSLKPEITQAIARFDSLSATWFGVKLPEAPESAWTKFFTLPVAAQVAIIRGINAQCEFGEGAKAQGIEAMNERAMFIYAKKFLCLLSDSPELEDIAGGDVVEILNVDHIQVYRSYNCFALCNYSLLELTAYPWFELYERSSHVTSELLIIMNKILSGSLRYVSHAEMPEYTLREMMTEERAVFALKEKFMLAMKSALDKCNFLLTVKKIREVPTCGDAGPVHYL
ncbi:MAG: hypothetical protein ACXVBE_10725 [Bdellovibrionota bacterium]